MDTDKRVAYDATISADGDTLIGGQRIEREIEDVEVCLEARLGGQRQEKAVSSWLLECALRRGCGGTMGDFLAFWSSRAPDILELLKLLPWASVSASGDGSGEQGGGRPVAGSDKLVLDLDALKNQLYSLVGGCQSGKTMLMAALIDLVTTVGLNFVLILSNDIGGEQQFRDKVDVVMAEAAGFPGAHRSTPAIGSDDVNKAQLGEGGKLIICLCNELKLGRLSEKLCKCKTPTIGGVDEADLNYAMRKASDVHGAVEEMRRKFFAGFLITATPATIVKKHPKLQKGSILRMVPPVGYKSSRGIEFCAIDDPGLDWKSPGKEALPATMEKHICSVRDPNLRSHTRFFDQLSKKRAWQPDVRRNGKLGELAPNIGLEMVTMRMVPLRQRFAEALCDTSKSFVAAWSGQFTLFGGPKNLLEHFAKRGKLLLDWGGSWKAEGKKVKKKGRTFYEFSSGARRVTGSEILAWIHNKIIGNELSQRDFRYILLQTTPQVSGRGKSHGEANWSKMKRQGRAQYFPTHAYMTFADSTDLSEIEQAMGRLSRVDNSVRPRTLYSQREAISSVVSSRNLMSEIFDAMDDPAIPDSCELRDLTQGRVHRSEKLQSKRSLFKHARILPKQWLPNTSFPEEATLDLYQCDANGYVELPATVDGHKELVMLTYDNQPSVGAAVLYNPIPTAVPVAEEVRSRAVEDPPELLQRLKQKLERDTERLSETGKWSQLLAVIVALSSGPKTSAELSDAVRDLCNKGPRFFVSVTDFHSWSDDGHARFRVMEKRFNRWQQTRPVKKIYSP